MPTPGQLLLETAGDIAELGRINDMAEGGTDKRVVQDILDEREQALARQQEQIEIMHRMAGTPPEKAAAAAEFAMGWSSKV